MNIEMKLADLIIGINNYPFTDVSDKMKPFICEKSAKSCDFIYHVHICDGIMKEKGILIFQNNIRQVYKFEEKYIVCLKYKFRNIAVGMYTIYDIDKKCAEVYLTNEFFALSNCKDLFMSGLDIDFILLWFDRIIMHASVVKYKEQGILFSGVSGVGKSTQAELWKNFMQADILNGDRATLDISGPNAYVYGSPYAGSSNIYRNESALVNAIVLLGQGRENSIERLTGIRAYKEMFPRFSIARWDDKLFNNSMSVIGKVIEKIPIYKLVCFPGEEAVQLVHDTLFQ